MNRDTPGAVPSDEFPFLGPAISPRRRDLATPLTETDELAGPFVGGMFQPSEAERPSSDEPASEEGGYDGSDSAPAAEEEDDVLADLPTAEWPSDDFPWLMPSEPEATAETTEEPWRATAEVEELAPSSVTPNSASISSSVQSWRTSAVRGVAGSVMSSIRVVMVNFGRFIS